VPEALSKTIAELEELEKQVIPGPWEWACDFEIGDTRHWNVHRTLERSRTVCLGLVSMATERWSIDHYPMPEMQLLTAARNAMPTLLAEIRRLRAKEKKNTEITGGTTCD
jgi:hypothetical protein